MKIKENKLQKNVAEVTVELEKKEVETHENHVVDEMVANVTVKGFRQGKAPKDIAVKHLDPDKLTDRVLSHVLNDAVVNVLKEKDYHLFGRPVLEKIDTKGEDGWVIDLSFPLFPEFKLPDYKKIAKEAKETNEDKPKKTSKKAKEEKDTPSSNPTDKIMDSLLKETSIDIPQSVINEEVNISLERLANQAKAINLTLESYLKAVNKSVEEIKAQYQAGAEENLKLDLILLAIAKTEKIIATEKEISETLEAAGLSSDQANRIKAILERRKTIEFLSKI